MNVYSTDLTLNATVYIKAESESDAAEKVKALWGQGVEMKAASTTNLPISGRLFNDRRLPTVSLSPAMTIHDASRDKGALTFELVEEDIPS